MDATRNTLELTDLERQHVSHALAEQMHRDCETACEDLRAHFSGSSAALADARGAVSRATEVAAILDRLEPTAR